MAQEPFGPRAKVRVPTRDFAAALEAARQALANGDHPAALDIYELLADNHPARAVEVLGEAWQVLRNLPLQDRYNLYQRRYFHFGIASGDRVLDVGSGNIPFPLATDLAELSPEDDDLGRAGQAFVRPEGVAVHVCSIEDLPFADQSFDFVYCSHVLEHVADPERACAELARVGRRGYVETPTRGKDLFLNLAGKSNHRWAVEVLNQGLVFTEYSPADVRGMNSDLLLDMHCTPRTERERAFSVLLDLKADTMNAMLLWEGAIPCTVRRLR